MTEYERMFEKVHKDWHSILVANENQEKQLRGIVKSLVDSGDDTTPAWGDVLKFAHYPFRDTKVLVVGQDPYPTAGVAHGLAFSTLAKTCPPSLRNIYKAMVKSSVLEKMPTKWNLERWCKQGIILMNKAWTTQVGKPKAHVNLWHDYVMDIYQKIADQHPGLTVLLWGNDAKALEPLFHKHRVLTWVHPSPMAGTTFPDCPHFRICKDDLGIDWNPEEPVASQLTQPTQSTMDRERTWYTDGSSPGNGRKGARAGWAFVNRAREIYRSGPVVAARIGYQGETVDAPPTNIRGEGYAILMAMRYIQREALDGQHTIVTDSQFWMDMIGKYIPKWTSKKDHSWQDHKNSDLCKKIWEQYCAMQPRVKFHHIRSHQKTRPQDPDQAEMWVGNIEADQLAQLAAQDT